MSDPKTHDSDSDLLLASLPCSWVLFPQKPSCPVAPLGPLTNHAALLSGSSIRAP